MKSVDYMMDHSEIEGPEKEKTPWCIILLAIVAMLLGMLVQHIFVDPVVHASEDVSGMSDKQQEKFYCHQILNGASFAGGSMGEIIKHCKKYE